jgi:hypothetical protein
VNASECAKKPEAETTALLDAEVDEAIATCGGDVRSALRATVIVNAYLEAEIERLTEAISIGFARGRDAQGTSAGEKDLEVDASRDLPGAVYSVVTITID